MLKLRAMDEKSPIRVSERKIANGVIVSPEQQQLLRHYLSVEELTLLGQVALQTALSTMTVDRKVVDYYVVAGTRR